MRKPVLLFLCSLLSAAAMAQVDVRAGRETPRPEREADRVPSRFPVGIRHLQNQQKPASRNWLLDADDDAERFRRLQTALGGSDMQMSMIGQRFEEIHVAIGKNNPALAA